MDVTTDVHERAVVVVSDEEWTTLHAASQAGWREVPGMGDGYSEPVGMFDPATAVLNAVLHAVIESELTTEQDRAFARYGTCYALITSPSRWDAAARWWSSPAPHTVGGHFFKIPGPDGRYRFAG